MVLDGDVVVLRDVWEATSFELEMRQCNNACVAMERDGVKDRSAPQYGFDFPLAATPVAERGLGPRIAIIR